MRKTENLSITNIISHDSLLIKILVITCILVLLFLAFLHRQENIRQTQELQEIAKEYRTERSMEEKRLDILFQDIQSTLSQEIPGIICWGDSLTAGAGGNGTTYPLVIHNLIENELCNTSFLNSVVDSKYSSLLSMNKYTFEVPEVLNMGVGGENTNTILGRNGSIPFVTSESITIPPTCEAVSIKFESQNGRNVAPLRQGSAGVNMVTIQGIEGILSIEQESYISADFSYYFTRNTPGASTTIPAGSIIETSGSTTGLNYLPVIFIGQNGGYADIDELISQQKAILQHQEANEEHYIIVGLHTGTSESRAELEAAMLEAYGNKYINLREYMSTDAMNDAGLEPTPEDIAMMKEGMTPASLLVSDGLHFNATAYELIGNLIYNRMDSLGYFDEVKKAFQNATAPTN